MELRNVIFRLGDPDGFHPDMSPTDQQKEEDRTKERKGVFHCWTPAIVHDDRLNQDVPTIVALLEDVDSGRCYEIDINHFKFVSLRVND